MKSSFRPCLMEMNWLLENFNNWPISDYLNQFLLLTVFILCLLASSFGSHFISDPYLERSAVPCRLGHQLSRNWRTAGVEDGVLDGTEWLEYVRKSSSISCSDIYGLCLKGKVSTLFEFWQSRRSNSENWFGSGWAVKLRGALCKTNLILSSPGLSMGGVDPLIDD